MRRLMLPALFALSVPALVGCPYTASGIGDPMMTYPPKPSYATPMPMPMPVPMVKSSPAGYPVMGPPTPVLVADGPSMDDAYHYVQRYVDLHYPGSEVVAIRATQVGLTGRIGKAGTWAFTYRMPTASASTQAVDLPSRFESRQLTFKLTGNNDLFAPEVTEQLPLQPFDFSHALPLGKALEACQGFGLTSGPAGLSVVLASDAFDGTYYEIDNSNSWSAPETNGAASGTVYMAPGTVRAKYRINALNGTLIARVVTP